METEADIQGQKGELRARMRAARKAIPPAGRLAAERAVAERLLALPEVRGAGTIGIYHAVGSELGLAETVRALRALGRAPVISYPLVISKEEMLFARFEEGEDLGLLDNPKALQRDIDPARVIEPRAVDVLLVPGIAFDSRGRRLGQGGGYYDRYLPQLREDAIAIGIAFDKQVVAEVPCGPHDRRVDCVATPTRLLGMGASRVRV